MATNLPLRRRLLTLALAASAASAFAACTIEFIDNDPGPGDLPDAGWGSDEDGGASSDAWDSDFDGGTPWPDADTTPWPDAAAALCGDGLVQGNEQCDNGQPGVNTATCDRDCTLSACGDALVNFPAGEQCDTGGASVSCDLDCTAVVCGDGLVNPVAGEQCDDGNASDGDACRNDCTLP